jgi:predicted dehydrogenase
MRGQVGIAVIGCGYWGINYIRVFNELPHARVVAVCDARPERLQEVGQRFPGIQLATNIEEILGSHEVDAVIICTPATTHYHVACQCLLAGKHILVEKPITTTVAEADKLIDLAASTGQTLMVGHTFIYNPAIAKIKEYLDGTEMGQLYYLYARRTNIGPVRYDVNAVWDLAPHDISIFNYLLDSTPEWVSAVGARVLRNRREDVGFISLSYRAGVVGHVHVSWADAYKVREVVVVGSNKRIVFNDFNSSERVRVFNKGIAIAESEASTYGEHQLLMRDGDIISPKIDVSEPLKNQCSHFLQCVTQGVRPLTDGWAGRNVIQVMEAIDRSIKCNGAPIEIVKEHNGVYESRYA